MITNKKIAIVNTQSPYSNSTAKESLDVALIMGSYEQDISLFFQDEGVRQLVPNQQLETLNIKDFLATLSALPFYDIDKVYVCQQSLQQRNLENNFNINNVIVLDAKQFAEQLHSHHVIYRF
jgi:tRNA 2-thiouridine synthesizing protein C